MELPDTAVKTNAAEFEWPAGGLDFLWLELTGKCNLACVHCYAESHPLRPMYERMHPEDWKRVLAEAFAAGCRNVQFIGGEPTIYPHLASLIQFSRMLGYEFVEVFTNGTVFTEPLRRAFQQFRVSLAFSIYGDTAAVHDSVTQSPGSFAKSMESIRWAVENELPVRVGIVETPQNAQSVESTRRFFEQIGVREVGVDRTRGIGRGTVAIRGSSDFDELCGNCWKGKLCVGPGGDMYPCVFSRSWKIGSAAEGVRAAIEGRPLADFRARLRRKVERELVNCVPARYPVDPGCQPDRQCNPGKSSMPGHAGKCNPHVDKCIPAKDAR